MSNKLNIQKENNFDFTIRYIKQKGDDDWRNKNSERWIVIHLKIVSLERVFYWKWRSTKLQLETKIEL